MKQRAWSDWYEWTKKFLQEKLSKRQQQTNSNEIVDHNLEIISSELVDEKNSEQEENNELTNNKPNELAELQSPQEAKWDKGVILTSRTLNNALAAAGIILSFQGKSDLGAGLLGVYPITEFVITNLEKSLEKREGKWNEFLNDADGLSDNFNELLGIIKKIDTNSDLGKTSKDVKNLKEGTQKILKIYDKNEEGKEGYGEIDLEELIAKRKDLAEDLAKSKTKSEWWRIVSDVKKLEDVVFAAYQKDIPLTKKEIIDNSQIEQQPQILQPTYGTPSSSKK